MTASLRLILLPLALAALVHAGELKTTPSTPPKKQVPFIEEHFAKEHHISTFDLASFFAIHDLDRNGILDRSEIEAIYGVHHSLSVKHSDSYEVHDEKADKIVGTVLKRLDTNGDEVLTKREFIAGGKDGLPSFPEFGEHALGHHYDEESEFFMHHEEIYHNTPESQKPEAYNHPEDHEHFAHHDAIEKEEERRERKAEGMNTIEEDERLRKIAKAKGEEYISPYQAQIPKPGAPAPAHEGWNAHAGGHAAAEAGAGAQHVFKGPGGAHVVKTQQEQAINAEQAALEHDIKPDRLEGETDHGYEDRLAAAKEAFAAKQAQQNAHISLQRKPNESDEEYQRRIARARFDAAKARPGIAPPQAGKGKAPNKYPPIGGSKKKKGSFFGEF